MVTLRRVTTSLPFHRRLFIFIAVLSASTCLSIYSITKYKLSHQVFKLEERSPNPMYNAHNVFTNINQSINETIFPQHTSSNQVINNQAVLQRFQPRVMRLNGSVVPSVYGTDRKAYQRYIDYLARREEPLPLQKKVVIILTNFRSGSSFFSEFLNQHPDVFYSFEPLIPVSHRDLCNENIPLKRKILSDMAQCIVPAWLQMYSKLPKTLRHIYNRNIESCVRKRFCFAPFTAELCTDEHCVKSNTTTKPFDCWADCGVYNQNLVENTCRRKKMTAIKLIRLCDINVLKELVTDYNLDLKVVHLLRDPRGIANSRHLLSRRLDINQSLRSTCNRQFTNANVGLYEQPDWLKHRYKLFRYEDAATNPFKVAKSLYDFVGLNFTNGIVDWIAEHTGQVIQRNTSDSPNINGPVQQIQIQANNNPWGRTRNSKEVFQKWTRRLPFIIVRKIESVCKDTMELAGYLPLTNVQDYRYNKTIQYFTQEFLKDRPQN
nr:carbohydrate sulfotransferase 1 isoform X1 [Ciona intestinalis]|eukprot:XP_002127553.1 carbohydrate sulfotransferase 1 isoform X1 [Ciona intestinalis]